MLSKIVLSDSVETTGRQIIRFRPCDDKLFADLTPTPLQSLITDRERPSARVRDKNFLGVKYVDARAIIRAKLHYDYDKFEGGRGGESLDRDKWANSIDERSS